MTTTRDVAAVATAAPIARGRAWLRSWAGVVDADLAFPAWARRTGGAAALASVALAWVAGTLVTDQASYLDAWTRMSALVTIPAVVTCALAARWSRPDGEHEFWRWSCIANVAMLGSGLGIALVAHDDLLGLRALSIPVTLVVTGLYMRANLSIMQRRSGGRSIVVDAIETAVVSVVLMGALITATGERLLALPVSWWTIPCVIALNGGIIGTVWAAVLHHRTPSRQRRVEALAVVLGVLCILDAAAQLAQGLSGFTLPAPPLLALQQLTMTVLLLITLNASRRKVPGLERLTPQRQVRSSRGITLFAIAGVIALGGLALATLEVRPTWALMNFAGQAAIIAMLLALRNLVALDETKRLYQQVAEAAEERQRLLAALTRSLEDERHRVAAQLHQQAISSYATFASFIRTASRASPSGVAPLPETSERVQAELSRAAEAWRELMLAVRPPDQGSHGTAERLDVATRALAVGLLGDLLGDAPLPRLTTAVDDRLHLDWATEALVLRIVQEALTYAHDHWRVQDVGLTVDPADAGVRLELTVHGPERSPGSAALSGELAELAPFVALGRGELTVEPSRTGVVLMAELGAQPNPERRPRLRVV